MSGGAMDVAQNKATGMLMEDALVMEFLEKEIELSRELLVRGRTGILEGDPNTASHLVAGLLLAQGWERVLKVGLFLARIRANEWPHEGFFRKYGHDVLLLRDDFVTNVIQPNLQTLPQEISRLWVTDFGAWLWEYWSAYATGGRYHGLEFMEKRAMASPDSHWIRADSHWDSAEHAGHPSNIWFDFYDAAIRDYGLASEDEVDDAAGEPAINRVNVDLASVVEDLVESVVFLFAKGYLGPVGRDLTKRLRFPRFTSRGLGPF